MVYSPWIKWWNEGEKCYFLSLKKSFQPIYYIQCCSYFYPPLLEIRVIIKISKKFLVSYKLWLIWIRMKQKKILFFEKKIQNGRLKKTEFFNYPQKLSNCRQNFQVGPWVSRIDWCKGHQCDSTYTAVRLSDVSPK